MRRFVRLNLTILDSVLDFGSWPSEPILVLGSEKLLQRSVDLGLKLPVVVAQLQAFPRHSRGLQRSYPLDLWPSNPPQYATVAQPL